MKRTNFTEGEMVVRTDVPVDQLGLSRRTTMWLERAGIKYVTHLLDISDYVDFERLPGIGRRGADEITEACESARAEGGYPLSSVMAPPRW